MASTAKATLTIPQRFNGPPASANGGYLAGALAQHVPGSADAIKVTLRKPPPLAVPMAVTDLPGNVVHLHSQATLIAEAEPGYIDVSDAPPSVEIAAAKAAELRFQGHRHHAFPMCFVCGPDRGDGMRLFPGAVDPDSGLFACTWTPDPSLARRDATDVRPEFVWAALDCPGSWTIDLTNRQVVLGQIVASVMDTPNTGETCVVTSSAVLADGRKHTTRCAIYGGDGRLLGASESVWIEVAL
jgi:hypothetical protein